MINTFKDLIEKGVAPSPYEMDTQASTPTLDPIVRHYNNYWGLATDTHCSTTDGKTYIITGSLVAQPDRFDTLLTTRFWQAIEFPSTWIEVMNNKGLKGEYKNINGTIYYVMA